MKRYCFVLFPLLVACGSDNDSAPAPTPPDAEGTVSIAISDAPVDNVSSVVLQLDSIDLTLQHQGINGDIISLDLSDQNVDLLEYQGEQAAWLIEGQGVPAGQYMAHLNVVEGSGEALLINSLSGKTAPKGFPGLS